MEALPYYKWFWQRFRASRSTQRMGYVARGLYRELLDEQWVKGGIPSDMQQLADICDCPLEIMQVEWPKMARCFSIKKKGLLMNGTLESMRTEMDTRRTKLSVYGKVGGVTKLNGDNAEEAKAKPELTRAKPKPSPGHIGEERRVEKSREEKIKPFARSVPPEELAGTLPLVDGSEYQISKEQIQQWTGAYPGIEVKTSLKQAKSWLEANPTRKKTRKGVLRFVVGWLDKAQNSSRGGGNAGQDQERTQGNAGAQSGEDGPDLYAALYEPTEQGKPN